jgi:hypothetical protein
MEEKPPTQAGRDVPRSRTPRSAFGTPDQPAPSSKPAERAPRRPKAPPAVTFQAPANDETASAESPEPPGKPTQRRSQAEQSEQLAAKKAKATPAPKAATPAKPAAKAAPPAKKAAAAAAKRAPKKVPSQATIAEPIDAALPATKSARAKKATAKAAAASDKKPTSQPPITADAVPAQPAADAVPAQPAADATPPAKAMPAQPTPTDGIPVNIADDPTPAQAISDATQPAKAAPIESREPEAERQPTTFSKLAADPGHAPELLALAAVQTIGPRAEEWAKRTRETYPKATDMALARLAADEFTRFTSRSSIVGTLAGSYAPVTLIATTALTHARVILHIAAAYGLDPTDKARAADLLVLTRVHATRGDAEEALAAVGRQQAATTPVQRLGRMVATNAAGWAVVRLASRYFPGTRLVAAALVTRSSVRNMAERAKIYYSQESHALGRSV